MPSSSWTNTSWQWSTHSPSPVHRSWSIHTRMVEGTVAGSVYIGSSVTEPAVPPQPASRRPRTAAAPPDRSPPRPHVAPPHRRRRRSVAWLRDRDDPDTIAYLEAENTYADAWFAEHNAARRRRCSRRSSRGSRRPTCRRRSAPTTGGTSSSTAKGRATRSTAAAEHRRRDRDRSCSTRTSRPTVTSSSTSARSTCRPITRWPHGRPTPPATSTTRCASATSPTGIDLPDEIADDVEAGVAWSRDGAYLFYVTADDQERPYRVMRHRLGTAPAADDVELVFEETDERFYVGIGETRSDDFVVIQSRSKTSSEMWLIPTDDPTADPVVVRPRRDDIEYNVDHWGDGLVILTNDDAVDFRVLAAPVADDWTDPTAWTELIAHAPGRRIIGVEPFAGSPRDQRMERRPAAAADPVPRRPRTVLDLGDAPHDVDFALEPAVDDHARSASARSRPRCPPTLLRRRRHDRRRRRRSSRPRHRTSTSTTTARHGCGPPPPTARRCRSTSSTTSTPRSTAPPPASSTATARTRPRCRRGSRSPGCRCSIGAASGRSCIPRAAASSDAQWYLDGKLRRQAQHVHRHARRARAPRRHRRRRRRPARASAAAPPAVCSSAPASRCAPTCSPRRRRGPVRRRRVDDERPVAAAHRHRVGGVGRPARPNRSPA